MTTSSIARPSKIYPNLDFWFENKPSGNPAPKDNNSGLGKLRSTFAQPQSALVNTRPPPKKKIAEIIVYLFKKIQPVGVRSHDP
jgi:hypothetical protein